MMVMLMRHGESAVNSTADIDDELTEKGMNESFQLANKVKQTLTRAPLQKLITSPYRRCRQTAEIVGQINGVQPQLIPELKPYHNGAEAYLNELVKGPERCIGIVIHDDLVNKLLESWFNADEYYRFSLKTGGAAWLSVKDAKWQLVHLYRNRKVEALGRQL